MAPRSARGSPDSEPSRIWLDIKSGPRHLSPTAVPTLAHGMPRFAQSNPVLYRLSVYLIVR